MVPFPLSPPKPKAISVGNFKNEYPIFIEECGNALNKFFRILDVL